jgi:photosystem II stability/assembly factor-like uncharacterized protein
MRIAVKLIAFLALMALILDAEEPRKLENVCTSADEDAFGLTCTEDDPCAVFLELSSVEPNGSTLFVTGNLHTVNTTMYGLLLETDDGGVTWTEPNKRMRSAALEEIQFADFQHGWISGTKLEPLPRDPFMLATTDGGKTWRQHPLFDETTFGSIQQFWFDSAANGELVLDRSQGATGRYERYVTMTGGTSWELEQTDPKPIRLAKARPKENSSFRLRADGGSYLVERRTAAGGWEMMASFAIHAGDCK